MTENLEATVTAPFKGVRDGEIYPVEFKVGDPVSGELAAVAVAQGWADATGGPAEPKKVQRRGRKS